MYITSVYRGGKWFFWRNITLMDTDGVERKDAKAQRRKVDENITTNEHKWGKDHARVI